MSDAPDQSSPGSAAGTGLYISEPAPRTSGPIEVFDVDHNDIAEFYHSDHATVSQSYETALALAKQLVAQSVAPAQPPNETYRETVRRVAASREKGYAAARANLQEAWSALAMIRETIETLAPSGSVKAAEHLDGPTFMHEAEALVAGILALPSLPSTQQLCAKCGCETKSEEALVNGEIWCHPCADGVALTSTQGKTP